MAFGKLTYNVGDDCRLNTVEPIRSKQDLKRIIEFFDSKNWHKYAVIFKFGCYSGLRISDILGLKVKDVRNKDRIGLREVKTGKTKFFPLQKQLQNMFNDWVKNLKDDDWVFEGRKNKKLDRSQVYRRINEAIEALKIDANVGTHTLRKTFGYHFHKQFNDVAQLQKIFNHSSPDVTQRYIGITQEEIDKCYLALNLEYDPEELDKVPLGNSRFTLRKVAAFCRNYMNSGGQKHAPFAEMVLEIIKANAVKDGKIICNGR